MGDWLYLIIGIAVVGVLTLAGLLTSGRRRKAAPPAGGTDVIAPPPTGTGTAVEAPPEPAVGTAPAVETSTGSGVRAGRARATRLAVMVAVVLVLLILPLYVDEFWLRTGFAVARHAAPLLRPAMRKVARRLWVDDLTYAERSWLLRSRGEHYGI